MATLFIVTAILFSVLGLMAGYVLGQSGKPTPDNKVRVLEDELHKAQYATTRYMNVAVKAIKSRDRAIKMHAELRDQIIDEVLDTNKETRRAK